MVSRRSILLSFIIIIKVTNTVSDLERKWKPKQRLATVENRGRHKFSEATGSALLVKVSGSESLTNKVTGESTGRPRGADALVSLGT